MSLLRSTRRLLLLGTAGLLVSVGPAVPQQPTRPAPATPRLEAVAETRLLMEGLNQSNLRGLEKLLRERPADVETWTFIRGQALLIAETGNLLLIRPPRNAGERAWMDHATDLRGAATRLARSTANQDFKQSRLDLVEVANSCNRCHQSFRVPTQLRVFGPAAE
jgi:hypothetical protein